MSWPVVITIAGIPRGKGAVKRAVVNGRVHGYTDAKTRSYEAQLRFAAQQAMGNQPPTSDPVEVWIVAGLQIPASFSKSKRASAMAGDMRPIVKPDADNLGKGLDGLNGIVWVDDKQIVDEHVSKIYAQAPFLRITVSIAKRYPSAWGTIA